MAKTYNDYLKEYQNENLDDFNKSADILTTPNKFEYIDWESLTNTKYEHSEMRRLFNF